MSAVGVVWLKTPTLRASPVPSAAPDHTALVLVPASTSVLVTDPSPAKTIVLPSPPLPAAQPARAACNNPSALGVARTVEIDTTGGPGFGFEHFKQLDFLRDKEVVLTFDDGPWPINTPAVLRALADECTTGIFFSIGKHATYHPEILKQVYAAGHTVGSHTWSHATLTNKKLTENQRKGEIEKGFSAVKWALGVSRPHSFASQRCSIRQKW